MKFSRIIATLDVADELAPDVLAVAASLARRDGATLEAVAVWPAPNIAAIGPGGDAGASAAVASQAILEQHKKGREDCGARLQDLVNANAPDAVAVVLDGDPGEEVARRAGETGADLIVTGSHQRGFWGSVFYGSSSRDILHDAPCAVFVVTRKFVEARRGGA